MNRLLKVTFLILIVFFLSIYLSKYTNDYYENKKTLTDEAIKTYEKDLKDGKTINSGNYLIKEKDYNNKISTIGIKTSNLIENTFKKVLKYSMRYLENMENE